MTISTYLRVGTLGLAAFVEIGGMAGGCSKAKSPEVLAEQVTAAKEAAAKQVLDARAEAGKGVKSVVKTKGGAADIARARAIGEFDIAMAQADGDHSIALKECQMQIPASQLACKALADAAYDSAAASAKDLRETRVARR